MILRFNKLWLLALSALVLFSCTDLEEELNADLTFKQAQEISEVEALLAGAYRNIEIFHTQDLMFALTEHPTDALIPPTRGTDWDDNGNWRVLHTHDWTSENPFITNTFTGLLEGVFNATNALLFEPDAQQEAEARFLRAFFMFHVADLFGQVPFRELPEGEGQQIDLLEAPEVLSATQAIDFVISELEAILPNLGDDVGPTRATKDAARALLAKAYLNKGVYADRTAPKFDGGDMQKVIDYADAITGYSLAPNYYENFIPANSQTSPEIIFASENVQAVRAGNVRSRWLMTLHYNQNPGGWNGFATLADFYDSFEEDDIRRQLPVADLGIGLENETGINAGFLAGQQVDKDGNPLEDRRGNPLAFTEDVALFETGDNLEVTGIRAVKYLPDFADGASEFPDNDYVLLRYADVMLMKAEALLRNNQAGPALTIVNEIRDARGASTLNSLTLDELLAERGRELWWEGHRRQDMIRFGKFLDAWHEKPATDATKLLYPIPNVALAANPNLQQNPGY
jgi:hypothetical protein